ncbi:MAG: polyribonucleotide nucleotidyltransferase [Anaerolineaceae bacterium]
MQQKAFSFSGTIGNHEFTFETGKLAGQAGGAVTLRVGDSVLFASATMSDKVIEGTDFFPLSVEYEEKMYAGGRIPGGFFRREGRPGDDAVLVARLTDRPLRPLFDNNMRNEVQIIMFPISSDCENPLDIMAINAASAALTISDIPWAGPVGAVRVGRIDGKFIVDPTFEQTETSDLDLRLAGTKDAILMVECGSNEVKEDDMVAAISFGHASIQSIIAVQEKMAAEVGKTKREVPLKTIDATLIAQVYEKVAAKIDAALEQPHTKAELDAAINTIEEELLNSYADETNEENEKLLQDAKEAFHDAYQKVVRTRILTKGIRPDGRDPKQIRPIWCEVNTSPRSHGSGLFTRGETQVMTLATLGTPKEAQEIDDLTPTESKRYIHHYNFPPFSTGEVQRPRRSRREIGHGALAERALIPVLPDKSVFPYTMRLVSEVFSSNGSTSMASVCASTLALMDTGVPIKAPVAGIAMGLIKENDQYTVLTDIQGLEDHLGDMDFKVAGTAEGITALQMDIKIKGITPEIMSEALTQAREARLFILGKITEVIAQPRPELKEYVPRITTVMIPIDKIGALIGPGGKNIRSLQETTNTQIDIAEDGTVFIAAVDKQDEMNARMQIEKLIETPIIGRIYTGKVTKIVDFGAFVEILPGTEGLVHISQLSLEHVKSVQDVVVEGDELSVMITEIDARSGKIRLSHVAVLEGWSVEEAREHDSHKSDKNNSHSSNRGRRNG